MTTRQENERRKSIRNYAKHLCIICRDKGSRKLSPKSSDLRGQAQEIRDRLRVQQPLSAEDAANMIRTLDALKHSIGYTDAVRLDPRFD